MKRKSFNKGSKKYQYFSFIKIILISITSIGMLSARSTGAEEYTKHRVIILSDIEADPDDTQSFVRLFLYSNEIDIKGIVATTSCWLKTQVNPGSIVKVIKAYGKVQANLSGHASGFPKEEDLLKLVKEGLPVYGMKGVGDGKDSEGSDWIIKILEEEDERPLWVSVWGGVNTLAQTLYKIEHSKTKAEAKRLISKLRVYTISDQDDSGIWIRKNYPDLFYIVSPGDNYGSATWSAINSVIPDIDNEKISNNWLARNIQQGHGPLGAAYPDVAYGMEGDTPAWLSLIQNGLNKPEYPDWGGWGGRYEMYKPDFSKAKKGSSGVPFEPEVRAIWTNAFDSYTPCVPNNFGRTIKLDTTTFTGDKVSLWRWRDDFQNDFAARIDWCTKSFDEANHPPVPVLNGAEEITVKSGQGIALNASDSYDPDGDNISFQWFSYPEAGTLKERLIKDAQNIHSVWIVAPDVKKKETAHIILKVTDKGEPELSRYKRIIVNILPK
ncbi:nucleoside hydrolase-like domain-containing protein [Draconibacterium halophilum]|nr:nucleoside hydrolase-like domain-containing protein [Draconibacterium halophilum]